MGSVGQATEHKEIITGGIRWSGVGQAFRIIFQTVVSILLARLLLPDDYGLLAMAQAITGVVVIFQFMGTSGPLVQRKELSDVLIDSVFWLNVVLGVVFSAAVAASSPWLALIYDSENVIPVIRGMSLILLLSSFGGVPGALIRRRMRFDHLAKVAIISSIIQGVLALVLAYLGYGVWALVLSGIAGAAADSVSMLVLARWRPRLRFSWTELKTVLGFSINLTASSVVGYVSTNADKLILGRWLGASALGLYAVGARFTTQPLTNFLHPIIARVMFPAYSSMQSDDELMRRTVTRALGGISFITFPLMAGMSAVADPFVHALLGEKWIETIVLMYFLGPLGALRSLYWAVGSILLARNKSGQYFMNRIVHIVIWPSAILIGVNWGLVGFLIAALIAHCLLLPYELWINGREIGLAWYEPLRHVRAPFAASAVMAGGVTGVIAFMKTLEASHGLQLAAAIAAGVIIYIAITYAFKFRALLDVVNILPQRFRARATRILRLDR